MVQMRRIRGANIRPMQPKLPPSPKGMKLKPLNQKKAFGSGKGTPRFRNSRTVRYVHRGVRIGRKIGRAL